MQNTIQNTMQSSTISKKPGIMSENLKTLTSSNYPKVHYFFLKLCTRFLLTNVYKRVCEIFWVICINLKNTLVFNTFINNSRSKQNFKKSHTLL